MMELTQIEYNFIVLLGAALENRMVVSNELSPDANMTEILRLSYKHKLYHMILSALPSELVPEGIDRRNNLLGCVATQVAASSSFLALLKELEDAGFHPLVVKGIVCRALYPRPELRPSSDEDLYISPEEFEPCCAFLLSRGWKANKTEFSQWGEVGWHNKDGLYIELHRCLFENELSSLSDLFAFDTLPKELYPNDYGLSVASMDPHHHFLYLILHAYKHFVHSGFGIRQVCDVGFWAKHYHQRLDWNRLMLQCEDLRIKGFAAALLGIARHYLNISLPLSQKWDCPKDYCLPMLKDILVGGIYGAADPDRLHSVNLTLHAVKNGKKSSLLQRALFPPKKELESGYPFIKKHPLLLPVAYVRRICLYAGKALRKEVNASSSIAIGKERVDLLRFYNILD